MVSESKSVSEIRSRANDNFLCNVIIVTIVILGITSILTFFLSHLTTPVLISILWLIALLFLLTEVLILYGNSQVDWDNKIDISRPRRIWSFIVPVIVIILFLFVVLTIVIYVTSIVT